MARRLCGNRIWDEWARAAEGEGGAIVDACTRHSRGAPGVARCMRTVGLGHGPWAWGAGRGRGRGRRRGRGPGRGALGVGHGAWARASACAPAWIGCGRLTGVQGR
eukprot:3891516-Pleurochrysis_carterae.AAC.1